MANINPVYVIGYGFASVRISYLTYSLLRFVSEGRRIHQLICERMIHCDQKTYQKANVRNNFTTPAMLNNINNRISIHEQQINNDDKF